MIRPVRQQVLRLLGLAVLLAGLPTRSAVANSACEVGSTTEDWNRAAARPVAGLAPADTFYFGAALLPPANLVEANTSVVPSLADHALDSTGIQFSQEQVRVEASDLSSLADYVFVLLAMSVLGTLLPKPSRW